MSEIKDYEGIQEFRKKARRKAVVAVGGTALFFVVAFLLCMCFGNYVMSPSEVFNGIFGIGDAGIVQIARNVRLPRVLCAALVGAALSVAGLTMQSLFKNPMASPTVLGISHGASFGASMAISFGIGAGVFGTYSTSVMAFVFCFITMALVYAIARTRYGISTVTLLLSGVAVGAFFNGLVSLIQYVADDDALQEIVFWTMGSFNKCNWDSVPVALVPILLGIVMTVLINRELNMVSAGEEQAANMGVNVRNIRIIAIVATSLCVAGSVAVSGTIGFVGLIIPHVFRMLVGPNHRLLIPLCIFGGAAFLMIMDTIAKAGFEMSFPVGVLTSLLGAPFFIYILKTRKKEVWE